jgi:2-methylcitrate dehydratase PrpD
VIPALAARLLCVALDDDLAEVARRRVFDTLGALVAGRDVEASRALAHLTPALGAGPLDEIRELCAATRSSEIDDIDRQSCTTPGSVAVPVALAVGAARGGFVLEGVVAGYEAMIARGEAIDGAHAVYGGTWPSYLAAPVAAAATGARVLGLDIKRTAHALAIAATRAVGTAGRIAEEPTSRWLTYGSAAADGALAAFAAEAGMVGDVTALDAHRAPRPPTASDPDRSAAADVRVGDGPWRIERVDVKPFCTARQAQSAVEAARLAFAELDGAAIDDIEVGVPEAYRAMIDQPAPHGRLTSIMSAQYQIAAALADEELLFDVARRDVQLSLPARDIARVTRVVADDELSALFPAVWPARVRMRSADGREVTRVVRDPEGSPDWDALRDKHARVGAWGDGLERALAICRGLGSDVAARELLDITRIEEAVVR